MCDAVHGAGNPRDHNSVAASLPLAKQHRTQTRQGLMADRGREVLLGMYQTLNHAAGPLFSPAGASTGNHESPRRYAVIAVARATTPSPSSRPISASESPNTWASTSSVCSPNVGARWGARRSASAKTSGEPGIR
jgi:hypothetical protein